MKPVQYGIGIGSRKLIVRITFFLEIMAISGCHKSPWSKEPGGVPKLRLSVGTWLDSTSRYLRIDCHGGDYEYHNVEVVTSFDLSGNPVIIKFLDTQCSGPCFDSQTDTDREAEGYVKFPEILDGDYSTEVFFGGEKVLGTLHVTPTKYELNLEPSNAYSLGYTLNKIGRDPYNSIILTYRNFPNHASMLELLNSIDQAGPFNNLILPPGRYSQVEILDNGSLDNGYTEGVDTMLLKTHNRANVMGAFSDLQETFETWKQSHSHTDCPDCSVTLQYGQFAIGYLQ